MQIKRIGGFTMSDTNNNEIQNKASSFQFTLLSGEILTLQYNNEEHVDEYKDETINITIESQIYNNRLYEAFKNKELIQFIQKTSKYRDIATREDNTRTTEYDGYFKIVEFETHASNTCCAYYSIRIESV